mmetsp:Transcript_20675/g.23595  ORF Transcript_20675/g.23595 Transcript_20675/m.23595 type:complete len:219 (-) Transcript_20675:165-821(-)
MMMTLSNTLLSIILLVSLVVVVVNGFSPSGGLATIKSNLHHQGFITSSSSLLAADVGEDDDGSYLDVTVTKPMGMVLEEIMVEDEPKGVYCMECNEESSAYAAGIRRGDVITMLEGMDVTTSTFEAIMEQLGNAESPVSMSLQQGIMMEEEIAADAPKKEKKKVKMNPRKLPTAKKLVRASTNVRFWKDPIMLGSLAFTVLAPLSIYVASILNDSANK